MILVFKSIVEKVKVGEKEFDDCKQDLTYLTALVREAMQAAMATAE